MPDAKLARQLGCDYLDGKLRVKKAGENKGG
jgi:hypothetical protein